MKGHIANTVTKHTGKTVSWLINSLHQMKLQYREWSTHKLLAKQIPWEPPNNPGFCKGYRLLSTSCQQGHIAETNTYTTHCTWRSRAVADRTLTPTFQHLWYSVCYQSRNLKTNTATNPFVYNSVTPARFPSGQSLC